jgi:hypothetical protein
MRNLISFLSVILITSTILTSCSGEGNQIYGKWFLQEKDNLIEFTEEGKVFGKEKEMQNFEFVGYFDFNDEKKTLTLKNCVKPSDNGTYKVIKIDDDQLQLERERKSLLFNRLKN